jgi:putative nucleotidyltransferase with HDIG domain
MSSNQTIRTRSDRVATIQIESLWFRYWREFTQPAALLRLAIAVVAAVVVMVGLKAWNPPFAYRQGHIPPRALVARVFFEVVDKAKTDSLKAQAAREVICYYENRNQPLTQLRGATKDQILRLRGGLEAGSLTAEQREALGKFLPLELREGSKKNSQGVANPRGDEPPPAAAADLLLAQQTALDAVQKVLEEEVQIERLDVVLRAVLAPIEETGLLKNLSHKIEEGNQAFIRVFESGQESKAVDVEVARVRMAEVSLSLKEALLREFRREFNTPQAESVALLINHFLQSQLVETLSLQENLTQQARLKLINDVQPAKITYFPSKTTMVQAGRPLRASDIDILRAEYQAWLARQTWLEKGVRLAAFTGMIVALYLLCGLFFHYQFDRSLLTDSWQLARLLSLSSLVILLSAMFSHDPWRAELLPLVMCAVTATIAYGRNVTLVLFTAIALATTLSLGLDLAKFVVLMAAGSATTLMLGRIRTRPRLIYVTAAAAVVTGLTTLGVGVMVGQVHGVPDELEPVAVLGMFDTDAVSSPIGNWGFLWQLLTEASLNASHTLLAGLVMTGLLPFVEKLFAVQTDLSLLELGDASHPLLRQLAQRAPGTYNHSINVAAIAEAAAESIGAHGLLTRVGAYFHDIGKMFKPTYFVENQAQGANRHDTLQPAMSTLVIIAHVKDGADLARQHRLPKPIIDFIEQHHGTTLVEFFYRKEAKKAENDPDADEVSEVTFRYPGPKPQSHESAILMLADAVESASRTLVEPTPTRLQNLIDQIAMKRLTDGQFDECGLTLSQLTTVKHSLLKSLTAIYHGRIKYSEQTA